MQILTLNGGRPHPLQHCGRTLMKRTIVRTALAIIFLATLHLCLAPAMRAQDDGGCSNATVAGKWGYTCVGTIILPTATGTVTVPVAAVGRFTFDRDGNLSGTPNRSNVRVSASETITAKIIVDARSEERRVGKE